MIEGRIAALNLYPVKGAAGVAVERARVDVTGLGYDGVFDREWMLVDASGTFLTQREMPRLALVSVRAAADRLSLAAPAMVPFELALAAPTGRARTVTVWRAQVRAFDQGDAVSEWLSAFLARSVRLVRFDRVMERRCNPDYAGDSGAHIYFADGYPVLVIGEASLADLNARLEARGTQSLPMNRFRPNLVVAGLEPYAEDHLDTLEASEVTLRLVKPCTRCQVTTTDQATGRVGVEPLPTLASYRRDDRLCGVTFGMNAVVLRAGNLRLGEPLAASYRF